jgi:hypothetical protein
MTIDNIYKARFENNYEVYLGTLRNQKKFNLGDEVFIGYGKDKIFRGLIRGVELEDDLNPNILYKIQIPNGLLYDFKGKEETSLSLTCSYIFSSLDDAKESRIKQLNKIHKLELENIERFFNQFKQK